MRGNGSSPSAKRLEGTSIVYKVPTRVVDGTALNLVVKWSRVGEVVPMDTLTINKFIHAEFNSPFEEFSLLTELRKAASGPAGIRIHTQRPIGDLRAQPAAATLADRPVGGQNQRENRASSGRGD